FLSAGYFQRLSDEPDKILINLQNGTFEITPTKQFLREFKSEDFLTYQLPFEYNPKAECPLFKSFLNEVQPDESAQNVLAEFVASIFIRRNTLKLEKALLLYGTGANGKSVFFEVINALLGTESVCNFALDKLTDDSGYSRAVFASKLLNYSSELTNKV